MDNAGRHGGHEERKGGHGEEQVDRAAPDAKHGDKQSGDDEAAEQVTGLRARHHGEHDADQGRAGQHEHGPQHGQRAEPAQQPT